MLRRTARGSVPSMSAPRLAALPTNPAAIAANAEALRAALVDGAVDALRAALRRTLGTVPVRPLVDGGTRYLHADFEGGDMPLLAWLAISDSAQETGIAALVAGGHSR